jgi:DNA (cytosine-5)-methyltransferase 1
MAANHWQLAVDVHNRNHPTTDHATVDLHLADPRYFPKTDALWASPECTKWSQAGGSKPKPAIEEGLFEDPLSDDAARRSRLLMFDVLRYAEHHKYRAMIVENVVDIATQPQYRLAWSTWQRDLYNLGYRFRVISLNSMHAQSLGLPAPQSRDRIYIGCWRDGDREPDFERALRPKAWCPRCELIIEARQAWKPGRTVGRYRQQYLYVHGDCGTTVEPGWLPAAYAIDWTVKGHKIGDRDKPLAEKTRRRIAAGIARYWRPFHLEAGGNQYDAADPKHPAFGDPNAYYRAWDIADYLRVLHTAETKALAVPLEGRDGKEAQPLWLPSRTQTTRHETAIAFEDRFADYPETYCSECATYDPRGEWPGPWHTSPHCSMWQEHPPFIAELRGGGSDARSVMDPAATFCANGNHHALVTPYYGSSESAKPTDVPIGTLTTRDRYALVAPAGGTWNDDARPTTEPYRAFTTREAYALIMRNNGSKGDGAEMTTPAFEAFRTLTTAGHQSVLTPGDMEAAEAQVDDCLFRMLEPHEVAAGMAFPSDYIWDGTRRERVKLACNAVTPPAARDLAAAVVEALSGEAA